MLGYCLEDNDGILYSLASPLLGVDPVTCNVNAIFLSSRKTWDKISAGPVSIVSIRVLHTLGLEDKRCSLD
jgi:hypothetical protein